MLTYCNAIVQNAMLLIVMAKANMLFYANKSTIFYFSTEWRPWEIKSNCSLYVVTVVPFILFLHPLLSYLLHKNNHLRNTYIFDVCKCISANLCSCSAMSLSRRKSWLGHFLVEVKWMLLLANISMRFTCPFPLKYMMWRGRCFMNECICKHIS